MIKCKKCLQEKPRTKFYKEKRTKRGYNARCIDCCKSDARAVFEANPEPYRERARDAHSYEARRARTLSQYGLTQDDYDRMLEEQNGGCAICGCAESGHNATNLLLVDHCHKTNVVRGLLCSLCNLAIGRFKDDKRSLIAATFYLNKYA